MSKLLLEGYHLEVTSWENDADNYKTEEIVVDTIEKVHALVKLAGYFTSCNYRKSDYSPKFGNADIVEDKHGKVGYRTYFSPTEFAKYLLDVDKDLVAQVLGIKSVELTESTNLEIISNVLFDVVYDLVGTWADCEYLRVVDSVECYYVPENIRFESVGVKLQ